MYRNSIASGSLIVIILISNVSTPSVSLIIVYAKYQFERWPYMYIYYRAVSHQAIIRDSQINIQMTTNSGGDVDGGESLLLIVRWFSCNFAQDDSVYV